MPSPLDHPLIQAMLGRRSVRHFTQAPVPREAVLAILEAGRWAPSGLNNQPWRFLVVGPDDPRKQALAACTTYARIVREAPVCLLVFLDRAAKYHEMKDHQGAGACIQNMLLAAHALGLGAVWLGQMVGQAEQVCQTMGLDPDALEFMTAIALGQPARPGASEREPLESLMLEPY